MNRNPVVTRDVTVTLKDGLHLTPTSRIVKVAKGYSCDILIHKADRSASAKSPLDILTLGAECGSILTLEATGENAAEAIAALADLFANNFPPAAEME